MKIVYNFCSQAIASNTHLLLTNCSSFFDFNVGGTLRIAFNIWSYIASFVCIRVYVCVCVILFVCLF